MAIITVESRMTHRSLMDKTKSHLSVMVLDLADEIDRLTARVCALEGERDALKKEVERLSDREQGLTLVRESLVDQLNAIRTVLDDAVVPDHEPRETIATRVAGALRNQTVLLRQIDDAVAERVKGCTMNTIERFRCLIASYDDLTPRTEAMKAEWQRSHRAEGRLRAAVRRAEAERDALWARYQWLMHPKHEVKASSMGGFVALDWTQLPGVWQADTKEAAIDAAIAAGEKE